MSKRIRALHDLYVGNLLNRANAPTAYDMSGLVLIDRYNNAPTIFMCGNLSAYALCFAVSVSIIALRGILLSAFPDRMVVPMKVQRSLRTRTTQYIMTQLYERHGTLSKQDIEYLSAQLKKPCPAHVTPDAFLADWQASLGDLAQAGQAIPQLMATEHLQSCFGLEYVDCWRAFVRDFRY